jgi:putative ABC transport system ATP-binding protein
VIRVEKLTYLYPEGKKIAFGDFDVRQGEHCLLLGESGCGKTTLLHLLGGLLRTNEGSIKIGDTVLGDLSESQLDHFRKTNLGFIFQKNHLISALNVNQNLLVAKNDMTRSTELLTSLNLSDVKTKKVTALSHGQAQRVAIARALMNKPQVILADEPTSALDDKNCETVIELLLNAAKANQSTLIIATHDSRLRSKISRRIELS